MIKLVILSETINRILAVVQCLFFRYDFSLFCQNNHQIRFLKVL